MTHITDQVRDLALRYTVAWCSQDPAKVAAFFSPAGSLRVNQEPAAIGRGAIIEVARGFMTSFPDLKVRMDDLAASGGRVIYRWTLTGTHSTGRPVHIRGFEEWRIGGDGLIAESQGHFDEADYQRQLQAP